MKLEPIIFHQIDEIVINSFERKARLYWVWRPIMAFLDIPYFETLALTKRC